MSPTTAELIAALPEETTEPLAAQSVSEALTKMSLLPVPVGRFQRLTALGTLQAKIGAAYLFHWLRGWFKSADEQKKHLAETHWRTALKMLDSMGYLRGLVMKVGQTLANYPDIAPREFVETLDRLHYDAPPMHWSLLREMVHGELGDDPENVFAQFEKQAFAAASLGQVHRATLKNGDEVAVKIQYPGIATSIQSDFRNLFLFMLPARLTNDWESTKDQLEDLRQRLEQETDYTVEANCLAKAQPLFHPRDRIVVPRVYPQFSTGRVLTMERLEGVTLGEYLERNPSQEERDDVARRLVTAWYRLMYAGRMLYVDFHPGNILVLDDGRLGLVDFGFILELDDAEWELYRQIDKPLSTGRYEDRIAVLKMWSNISDDDTDRLRVCDEYAQWSWMSRYQGGEYDFGDEADFRRGVDLFAEMVRKRYTRGRPNSPVVTRSQFGWRAILYQLQARIDIREIAEEEIKASGWDRSGYLNT